MKRFLLITFFALLCFTYNAQSQVGIGTTSPNASLEVVSSNVATPAPTDGILIPKVAEFPATNPSLNQDGMLVYATGGGSVTKGFYYWDNTTTTWTAFTGATIEKVDELTDGKSDNDGTNDGSSLFLGVGAGLNDDSSDNRNAAYGFRAMRANTTGARNTAVGYEALFSNTDGLNNVANGYKALTANTSGSRNTANGEAALFTNTTGNDNTAYGTRALFANITGAKNVAVGNEALSSNTVGRRNTATGYQTLAANITGFDNVAIGNQALQSNTTGHVNVAIGALTLQDNLTGVRNVAIGGFSLSANLTGAQNVAVGQGALQENTSGNTNVAIGANALGNNEIGIGNTALGFRSMLFNIDGVDNVAVGSEALLFNTTGLENVAVGTQALTSNTNGASNSAIGYLALTTNTTGAGNVANGDRALFSNVDGDHNTALGHQALFNNISGVDNVAVGYRALRNTIGNNNVAIGRSAGFGTSGIPKSGGVFIGHLAGVFENNSNRLYIENSNSMLPLIYGEFDTNLIRINGRAEIGSPTSTNDGGLTIYKDGLAMMDVDPIGGFVFNEQGDNLDFRAESNTVSHLLFLDAGDDVVRFGRSNTSLTNDGSVINGIVLNYLADFENPLSSSGATIGIGTSEYIADLGTQKLGFRASLLPAIDNTYDLGFPALRWDDVYATNGIIQTSDLREKENVAALEYGLAEVLQLTPISFQWKEDYDRSTKIGLSAQELQQVIPEVVKDYYYEHPEDGSAPIKMEAERLGVYYSDIIPVLIKAIQEQDKKIELLEKRLRFVENK